MILLQSNPYGTWTLDFLPQEQAMNFIQRFKDDNSLEFRSGWTLQETQTGKVMNPTEVMLDDRLYNLNVWMKKA